MRKAKKRKERRSEAEKEREKEDKIIKKNKQTDRKKVGKEE